MLHTKFQYNRSAGTREEDFNAFNIYGHRGHIGQVI